MIRYCKLHYHSTETSPNFKTISQITGVKISLTLYPTLLEYETLEEKKKPSRSRSSDQEESFLLFMELCILMIIKST